MNYTEAFQTFFRDSVQTLVITEDFRVSLLPEDLYGICLIKIKYFSFIFQLQKELETTSM